jgi:uncharacterized protein (DUF1015 family)
MRLFAFQGLRYDRPAAEIDPLAAPPYDQLDDRSRDRLHAVSPHQFTHLTMPLADAEGDAYGAAGRLHERWMAEGVIARDEAPALYLYSIELADGGRRLGVCGLVGLEEPGAGIVRPHEETLAKPLADRVALLEATRVDLEPILLLSGDGGQLDALIRADLDGAEPLAVHAETRPVPPPDPATVLLAGGEAEPAQPLATDRHLLFRVDDPDRIAAYRELLAPLPVAIADGHHRYKTAYLCAQKTAAAEGTAAAAKMAVITSLSSPGLTIDPIHRGLRQPIETEAIRNLLLERRQVATDDAADFAAEVASASQPALGVWRVGRAPEVWLLDSSRAAKVLPLSARSLTVSLLHALLLPALGFSDTAGTDGTVVYRSDPMRLGEELEAGELSVGLFLPPMSPQQFAAAIADGDMLPPKATRFLPKLVSGLVWGDHDSRVG